MMKQMPKDALKTSLMWCFCVVAMFFIIIGANPGMAEQQGGDLQSELDRVAGELVGEITKYKISRKTVAVMDFSNVGKNAEDMKIGETVGELLNASLAKHDEIEVIERKNLQIVIDEIGLGQSGLVDDESAVAQAGNILGANIMVMGSVVHVGQFYNITARVIYVKTAQVFGVSHAKIHQVQLQHAAREMFDLHKYPMNAVYRSAIMPGWGQFFNDKPFKGYIFLGTEGVLLVSAIGFHIAAGDEYDEYHKDEPDTVSAGDRGDDYLMARNISLGLAGAVWIYGMVDAYRDSRSYNKRIYGGGMEPDKGDDTSFKFKPIMDGKFYGIAFEKRF